MEIVIKKTAQVKTLLKLLLLDTYNIYEAAIQLATPSEAESRQNVMPNAGVRVHTSTLGRKPGVMKADVDAGNEVRKHTVSAAIFSVLKIFRHSFIRH